VCGRRVRARSASRKNVFFVCEREARAVRTLYNFSVERVCEGPQAGADAFSLPQADEPIVSLCQVASPEAFVVRCSPIFDVRFELFFKKSTIH